MIGHFGLFWDIFHRLCWRKCDQNLTLKPGFVSLVRHLKTTFSGPLSIYIRCLRQISWSSARDKAIMSENWWTFLWLARSAHFMKYLVQTPNELTPISEIFCRYVIKEPGGSEGSLEEVTFCSKHGCSQCDKIENVKACFSHVVLKSGCTWSRCGA